MKEVIDVSKSLAQTKIFLEVSENNEAAISLYKNFKFKNIAAEKIIIKKDEDAFY